MQNLLWATGYNAVAIPLAAGIAAPWGVLLTPAADARLMSASTVTVAINARRLAVQDTDERGRVRVSGRRACLPAPAVYSQ